MRKHPDRLVFIDETSVKTNLTRQYGRSLCGKRLEMDAPFGAWGTQTFIAGLKHDNLIAPWVIKGAMDGEAFEAYVRNVLAPELQPGTVVICDNLATHYNQATAATLREVGCWFLYLPPYSPDINPIEMAFSKLKAHPRRIVPFCSVPWCPIAPITKGSLGDFKSLRTSLMKCAMFS